MNVNAFLLLTFTVLLCTGVCACINDKSDVPPVSEEPYVLIPDKTFELYLVNRKIDDTLDGKLLRANAQKVTRLDVGQRTCCGAFIYSLQGIEAFTNLTFLFCANQSLSKLDLSRNTQLDTLYCNGNRLTELDVSSLSNLTMLYCSNTTLTSMDVSKNPKLSALYCNASQLNSLDLTHNPALIWLSCSQNKLVKLDVSRNPALDRLYCSNNQLTQLDLRQNRRLTSFSAKDNLIQTICVADLSQIAQGWSKDDFTTYQVCR